MNKACAVAGLSIRTIQRWTKQCEVTVDGRTTAIKSPRNRLSDNERQEILRVCSNERYASLPPNQIVPRLADEGIYLASESTMYRILRSAGQLKHRGKAKAPRKVPMPTSHCATGSNQVWSWDITYLPSKVKGRFWYLYMMEDIYSRKAVGWEVHDDESGDKAATLLTRTVISEQCFRAPLVLHSDNGAPMKSATLLSKMYDLGITPSRGRPRVSNDNPYSESLFRTLKYCPKWPSSGFATLDDARSWVYEFVQWYNQEHRHSRIRYITPNERHQGKDKEVLEKRHNLYQQMKTKMPERWAGKTRNWHPIGAVMLNPDRAIETKKVAA